MKKRILAVLLCCAMLLGVLPIFAQASDVPASDSLGTVYLSISDDAKYVEGNDDAGTIMAYVPVSLDEVAKIKLEDYNLSKYIVLDKEGNETVTVLHLFLYALKNFYGSVDEKAFTATGAPGSLFMTAFWGHDCNLTYYVNAEYPEARPGWGATADIIPLKSGDFIDLSMYTSWAFYSDDAAGYHYFLDADGKITHDYTTDITQALPISYGRTWGGMGGKTVTVPETTGTLYYSKTFYDKNAQSVTVDAEGKAQITFPSDGTWYLWADGSYGKSAGNEDAIVSAPAYAKVIVTNKDKDAAQAVADLINALPSAANLTLADKDAVAAAREALSALTEAQLAYVSDETLALLEKAEAKLAALEKPIPFTDLTQDWYQESVAYVYRNNLMYGTTNTTFSPDANLTRAMFAAMLYRLAGSPRVVGTCSFPDVPSTAYYLDAVIWGEKNRVIYGEGGKFNPDGKITREQMAAMMRRYADFCELKTDARADLSGFTDAAAVSSWALNDMKWAVAEHLLYGDTNSRLNPTNNATRAEAAAILQRFATRLAK